ncbi:MAG: hypothetical protein JO079_11330 [Frankiaceae bacterium]|nr:hypothetical protein [Frankiaceae bacterium]MBV9369154.1 hypothetical protein [Frankiales bacterium]
MRAVGRLTAAAVAVVAVQALPVTAYADSSIAGQVAGQVSTCKLDRHSLFASPLTATTGTTASGEVDFTWHADAHATVSSPDPCVTAVMVQTQLTDTTTVPNCPPVVQSPTQSASSNDPFNYQSGASDYEVDNAVDFKVAYFGGPTATRPAEDAAATRLETSGSSSSASASLARCYRLHSTVTETDTAYYANSVGQYVPFCSEQVVTEFVSTPAGPERVGDPIVESITC